MRPICKKYEEMIDSHTFWAYQEPSMVIGNEVLYLDSLKEIQELSMETPVKMGYNALVHCRKGRVLLEIGGNEDVVRVQAGQLLLVPAQKLMQSMMVSTDVDAGILLVSDRVLKRVLGSQIDIWNRAMYLHNTYVIDWQRWKDVLRESGSGLLVDKQLVLYNELVVSFLRILLLIICEELLKQERIIVEADASTDRDKMLFNQFLELLSNEQLKRQQVSYYADKLHITSKYLSTICRKVSGKSPIRWITDSVMEDCYQQLRTTNLTVKEISNKLGFPNSSFFGQYFREQAGMTPMEYRIKNAV